MDRRTFLGKVTATVAGSGVVRGAESKNPKALRSVNWEVKGFTCITCAVGLEVMLRGLKGVARANASYPANRVTIEFDERAIPESAVKEFIRECGFLVG